MLCVCRSGGVLVSFLFTSVTVSPVIPCHSHLQEVDSEFMWSQISAHFTAKGYKGELKSRTGEKVPWLARVGVLPVIRRWLWMFYRVMVAPLSGKQIGTLMVLSVTCGSPI
jgi:hypothetical protein